MRRAITREDKKILDKNCQMLSTRTEGSQLTLTFPVLSLAFVGAGAFSTFTVFGLMGEANDLSMCIFFLLSALLAVAICAVTMFIQHKLFTARMFKTGRTNINGGTIIYNQVLKCVEYIEDGFTDQNGAPYLIRIPEHKSPMRPGERVLEVINGDSVYLMKLNEQLAKLLPGPDGWQAAADSKHIGHQREITFHDYSVPDGEERIRKFFKTYKNIGKYTRSSLNALAAVMGFLVSVLVVFLLYGMIFRFIPALDDLYFPIALPLIPQLTIAAVIVSSQLFKSRLKKRFTDFNGVSRVILTGVPYFQVGNYARTFNVVEKNIYGETETKMYTVQDGFDARDVMRMKPGQIIYKYTYGRNGVFFGTR